MADADDPSNGTASAVDRWLPRATYALVGVFLLYALIRFSAILGTLYANSDSASALTLGEFFDDRGQGQILLGNYAWLEPLYLEHWTHWVPHHKQFWELLPFGVYVATLGGLWWSLARVSDRRLALFVVLVMATPAPFILGFVGVPNGRGHTLLHVAVLTMFLISSVRVERWPGWRQGLWAVGLAVTLAPGISSDQLLLIGGVGGFGVAMLVGGWLGLLGRRTAVIALVATGVGVGLGRLLITAARHDGVVPVPKKFVFANSDGLMPHVRLLLECMGLFIHGHIGGAFTAIFGAQELLGLATFAGLPLLLLAARSRVLAVLTDTERTPEARLLLVFWLALSVAIAFVFIATTAPVDVYSARYLTTLWPAVLVVVALVVPRRAALRALAGLAVICAAVGIAELADGQYTATGTPHGRIVGDLRKFVEANHADHGYAGYWESAAMTAETDFHMKVYPVIACGDGRCPFYLHRIDSWYAPKTGVRSFYVVDSVTIGPGLPAPPTRWGKPLRTAAFGQLTVYVYAYDIAARLPEGT